MWSKEKGALQGPAHSFRGIALSLRALCFKNPYLNEFVFLKFTDGLAFGDKENPVRIGESIASTPARRTVG